MRYPTHNRLITAAATWLALVCGAAAVPLANAADMRRSSIDDADRNNRQWSRDGDQGNRHSGRNAGDDDRHLRHRFQTTPNLGRDRYGHDDRDHRQRGDYGDGNGYGGYGRGGFRDGYRQGNRDGYGYDRGNGAYGPYRHDSDYGRGYNPYGFRGDGYDRPIRRDYPGTPDGMRRYWDR